MAEGKGVYKLSEKTCEAIDHWVAKYPETEKRSAVVSALLLVQEEHQGHLTPEVMQAVARYLELADIEVYEVATFYDMFELSPTGRHIISVCTNVSCMLRGSDQIVDALKQRLGVGLGETTPDGHFTLKETECLAACDQAPMCQVNHRRCHGPLTPDTMNQVIDQLEKGTYTDAFE